MKYFNLHYLTVFMIIGIFCYYSVEKGNETVVFHGFAQNKETEVRVAHNSVVKKIHIKDGEKVSKGEALLEISRAELTQQKNNISSDISNLESQYHLWVAAHQSTIRRLEAEKEAKISEVEFQIKEIKSRLDINSQLVKDLKSIDPSALQNNNDPTQIKIKALEDEKDIHVRRIENEIEKIQSELNTTKNPTKIAINKLKGQLNYANEEEKLLKVLAPEDGVVGGVACKLGENVPAFSNFLTIYDDHPTVVKGYVLESLMVHVEEGDIVTVSSVTQAKTESSGKVTGLGSRIVEIPERLRRNPMIKTYGREVVIAISPNNTFLQSEKALLKLEIDESPINVKKLAGIFSRD